MVALCLSLAPAVGAETWSFQEVIIDETPLAEVRINDCSVGDFDRDGYPDFWLAGRGAGPGHFSAWYRNPGPDAATLPWTRYEFAEGSWKYGVVGDVDGDGDDDILASRDAEYVSAWAENDGTPTVGLWPVHDLGYNGKADLYYISDFNHDGINELVLMFKAGPIVILRNPGDPTLSWIPTEIQVVEASGETAGGSIGDVDNDGDADIVYGNKWHENPGATWTDGSTWVQHVFDSTWTIESRSVVVDINRDGRMDIVVSGEEALTAGVGIAIYTTTTPYVDDGWTKRIVDDSYILLHSLQVSDFDNDGDLDIYSAEMHWGSSQRVAVFEQDGDIDTWIPHIISNVGTHNSHIADFDLDGRMDIVGKNYEGDWRPRIWFNRNPGTVLSLDEWEKHVIETSLPHRGLFIDGKDLNRDGLPDLTVGAWWWPNPGRFDLPWVRTPIGGFFNNFSVAHDFDNDGDIDLFGTDGDNVGNDLLWAQNNGSGAFTVHDVLDPAAGDFLQGIAVGHAPAGANQQVFFSWHREEGMGTSRVHVPWDPAATTDWSWESINAFTNQEEMVLGDIDRDGRQDLHLGTQWLRQEPGGSFSLQPGIAPIIGGEPDRMRLADVDHDGDLDLVVGAEAVFLVLWAENQNAGQTWVSHTIATDFQSMSLDVGDIDKDGDVDVVAGAHDSLGEVSIYENVDAGSSWITHVVDPGEAGFDQHDGTQLRDMDSDGDLDIISTGFRDTAVVIYENTSSGGVGPIIGEAPVANAGGNETFVDLDNDGFAMVILDGSASLDPDGTLVSYEWFEGLTPIATGAMPGIPLSLGQHTMTLRVTDNDENTASDVVTLIIVPENGPPSASLIAHWKLDETAGLVAEDSVAFNDGNLLGGPLWQPAAGVVDGALEFDGIDDSVEIPGLDISGGAMTIAFWFKADDFENPYARFISKSIGADNEDHFWMVSTNKIGSSITLRFRLKTNGTTTKLIDANPLSAGVWTHVAATYDGSNMRIYVNGLETASTAKSGNIDTDPTALVAIGSQPSSLPPDPFDGLIDDMRFYNDFLTPDEIGSLICAGDPLDSDGDGVADACDPCPTDNPDDSDGDTVCDTDDVCAGGDDTLDTDGDGIPNACDSCLSVIIDTDGDGVCDSADICPGADDNLDSDGDGVADCQDSCPTDNPDDSDGDGVCDSADICPGFDDAVDTDGDGVPSLCDNCINDGNPGQDDLDADGIGDACDIPGISTVEIVDFEDIPVAVNSAIDDVDYSSGSLFFDISDDHSHFANGDVYVLEEPMACNDTTFFFAKGSYDPGPPEGWTHPSVVITLEGGGPFDLHALDMTESLLSAAATEVEIAGSLQGGGTVSTVVVLDGILDGVGAQDDFEAVSFDDRWMNLTSVRIQALSGWNEAEWGIDNLEIGYIPEPSLSLLQGVGLGCLLILGAIKRQSPN